MYYIPTILSGSHGKRDFWLDTVKQQHKYRLCNSHTCVIVGAFHYIIATTETTTFVEMPKKLPRVLTVNNNYSLGNSLPPIIIIHVPFSSIPFVMPLKALFCTMK